MVSVEIQKFIGTWVLCLGVLWGGQASCSVSFIGAGPKGSTYNTVAQFLRDSVCSVGKKNEKPLIKNTGGSLTNLKALNTGEFRITLAQGDLVDAAFRGQGPFSKQEPYKDLRVVARLYPEYVYVVVQKESSIASIKDFKGKHVGLGAAGSGTLEESLKILRAYDLQELDVKGHYCNLSQTLRAFKRDKIEAFFVIASAVSPILKQIALEKPFRLLPIQGKERENLLKDAPMLMKKSLDLTPYNGQGAVETISVSAHLLVDARESTDYVYGLTKNLWESKKTEDKTLPSLDFMLALHELPVPLHPGAEKYYKERQAIP